MKEVISSLELFYMVKELQDIINGRIDKVYQQEREFLFTMHVSGKGKYLLKILPNAVYLTEHKEVFPETPPGYCQFLRKYLANSRIRSVKQHNFERIIEICFETKESKYFLIVELFANGNVILCNEEYKVLSALESHKWKDRTLRGGITYEYPPEQINILTLTEDELASVISKSKRDGVVKTIAINLGLGGLFAEEICHLAKVDKNKAKVTAAEVKVLFKVLQSLLKKKIKANIVGNEILPFEIKHLDGKASNFFESFNLAIDSVFSKNIELVHQEKASSVKKTELSKHEAIIRQQETTIKGLEISSVENKKKGEFIYEHYEEIKQILADINNAREKVSWKEIKEKLAKHKVVKKINESSGEITIEL